MLVLGRGKFGTVIATNEHAKEGIKFIKHGNDCNAETDALANIKHENVIKLLAQYNLEYLGDVLVFPRYSMNLEEYIDTQQSCTANADTLFAVQLLRGLDAVHYRGYMHRDIKPDNLFVDLDARRLVIGDFGLSTKLDREHAYTVRVPSPCYSAPEVVFGKRRAFYNEKIDVFAAGIVLYELFTKTHLFKERNTAVTDLSAFVQRTVKIPEELKEVMKESQYTAWLEMMRARPEKRCSAIHALRRFMLN